MPIIDKRPVNENDIDGSYDERGNLLKLSGTQNLRWNYRDNIAYVDIVTRPSGKNDSECYVYDSSGQRVRKVTETYQNNETNSTRVEKIYFGDLEVTRTYKDNNLSKEKYTLHVADDKSRVALHHYWTKGTPDETQNSQSRYQLSNHLDSVALELNDNAEIMSYEEYLPFGGTALIARKTVREITEKEYRYSGKEKDDSTGLYYYGARYYATWLLRWVNPDPAGTVDGLNLYQFVKGNPVNSVDIGGMCEQTPEKDASQNRKRKSYPARKRPLYKYVASDSEDEGTEEITQVKAKKNPKTIKIREHHRHFLSRFKHYLYAGAIEQRVSPNRNFLIAPSSEFNPMKQDFRNLGYGKEYQESHTVALTVTPEAEASGGNNVQELIAEVAHTQMQNRKFNKIGGPGAYIDKAQKEGGLKLLRQIDYSKGANEENIKLAEEIKQQFIMAVGGKENPLAQSLVKQDIKSILDRGKEYYENPQHKNKKLTKRPQPANDNQPRKKPKMADAA